MRITCRQAEGMVEARFGRWANGTLTRNAVASCNIARNVDVGDMNGIAYIFSTLYLHSLY